MARFVVHVPAGFVASMMLYPRPDAALGLAVQNLPRLEIGTTGRKDAGALHFATREAAADLRDMIYRHAAIPGEVVQLDEKPQGGADYVAKYVAKAEASPDTGACPRCRTCRDSMHRAKACDCGAPLMRDCGTCLWLMDCRRMGRHKWCAPYSFLPGWREANRA